MRAWELRILCKTFLGNCLFEEILEETNAKSGARYPGRILASYLRKAISHSCKANCRYYTSFFKAIFWASISIFFSFKE